MLKGLPVGNKKGKPLPKESSREIKPLTSLRAIAAALVFFYHFIYLRNPMPARDVFGAVLENGFIGVTLFFVLSSFVLTLRYYGDIQRETFRWGIYIKRRVARIYPIYFFLLAWIVLLKVPINITNVTLTQGFFTKTWQTGLIATWSLTVEECFYFMLPLVLKLLARLKHLFLMGLFLLGWAVAMLALGVILVNWSHSSGAFAQSGFMGDLPYMLTRTLFGYIFDFAVGTFAALLYIRRGAPSHYPALLASMCALGGILLFQSLMAQHSDYLTLRLYTYGVAFLTGVLILGLSCEDMILSRILSWSPLVYLGRISYTLYLLQLTQIVWFMANMPVLVFYAGANVLSAVLYELVESPSHRLILGKYPVAPWLDGVISSLFPSSGKRETMPAPIRAKVPER